MDLGVISMITINKQYNCKCTGFESCPDCQPLSSCCDAPMIHPDINRCSFCLDNAVFTCKRCYSNDGYCYPNSEHDL